MPGSWRHLASRFLAVIRATPLTAPEESWVRTVLQPGEAAVFFAQSPADQRHGHDCARWVTAGIAELGPVRAALLHDVGKRHSRLGTLGRSLATIAIKLRLPLSARWRQYRDHGALGAAELSTLGAEPLVVGFAREHHSGRPTGFDQTVWDTLQRADVAPPWPGPH